MTPIPSSGATRSSELKPGRIPSWRTSAVAGGLGAEEPEAHARQPRVRLVMGLEHRRQRRGLEDAAVLVGATAEQRRDEAGHVAGRRVDPAGSGADPVAIRHGCRAAGARARSPSPGATRSARSGRDRCPAMPSGLEDALAEVALERHSAHVLDDLAKRRVAVVAVGEGGAGLDDHPQPAAVVLGERRQRLPELHAEERRSPTGRRSGSRGAGRRCGARRGSRPCG